MYGPVAKEPQHHSVLVIVGHLITGERKEAKKKQIRRVVANAPVRPLMFRQTTEIKGMWTKSCFM
jgi:hypothetical protein